MPGRLLPLLALLGVGLAGCSSDDGGRRVDGALSEALREGAGARSFTLDSVLDAEWDRLDFVCPYEEQSEVTKRLGFEWADSPAPFTADGLSYFVFSDEREVVGWGQVSRAEGDPCGGARPTGVPRRDARFRLEETDVTSDGRPFFTLLPAGVLTSRPDR